jgi:hypothetical protein
MEVRGREIIVDGFRLENREHLRWYIARLTAVGKVVFGPEEIECATVTTLRLVTNDDAESSE